jgi:hypothetical protein
VNDHQYHHQLLLHKLLSDVFLVFQFHHDQSSLNVFQLHPQNHVTSSLNVGFNMDPNPNDEPSFNVLVLLINTQLHEMSSFNMNNPQLALFVTSNALVLPHSAHLSTFNNMVLHFLMLAHLFHKLVLLVLLKISQLKVSLVILLQLAEKLGVLHQALLLVVLKLLMVVLLSVVDSVHHHGNHQASQVVVMLVSV